MNNPIHTHNTELDITCAGQTKTHELRVMYTYTAGYSEWTDSVTNTEMAISPPIPAIVEIHEIKERIFQKYNIQLETEIKLFGDF